MTGFEPHIVYTTAVLLLVITASRFLLQELIAVVVLFKQLKETIKKPSEELPKRKPFKIASG